MRNTSKVTLKGARVLRPDGAIARQDVPIADGRIVDCAGSNADVIDCTGLYVLPGIVDVHGDSFERELHPRPGVSIDARIALTSVDRLLIGNGITTAFHGLTLSWEPGQRSLAAGRAVLGELDRLRPRFHVDHRVQIRWETYAFEAVDDVIAALGTTPQPALAFNDHTTATLRKLKDGSHKKLDQWASRAGLSPQDYIAMVDRMAGRASDAAAVTAKLAKAAREAGAIMLSHDDTTVEDRRSYRELGANVCEFPLTRDVAYDAVAHGNHVVLGGPNVIRGGSHTGALTAQDAIGDRLCSVLASDYYYPSLFHAAELLTAHGVCNLADAWRLISSNPARAMGLHDRGEISPGKRADLVVADCSNDAWRLIATVSRGQVFRNG